MKKQKPIACIVLTIALAAAFAAALLLSSCTDESGEQLDENVGDSSPAGADAATSETPNSDDELDYDAIADAMQPMAILVMEVNGRQFYPDFADNGAAMKLREMLDAEMLEISLDNDDGSMKSGSVTWALPASDEDISTQPGDIVLSQGDTLCLCYRQAEGSFTPLLSIGSGQDEDFFNTLGSGDVTLRLWLEWTE